MSVMTFFARQGLFLVACLCFSVWVPVVLDAVFDLRLVRGAVLYSPVTGGFLIQEYLPSWRQDGLSPEEAATIEHGMIHRTEDGAVLTRLEFENALPFLYAEGMRLRGLVPATLAGKTYDLEALRRGKLILGLRPAEIGANRNDPDLYALLDSRPDRVNLVFPEDRFRLRGRLEFVNADTNAPDPALSDAFNAALAREGFAFPATAAFGRDTIIKPWDAGWFLLDATGELFNLRRVRDQPLVRRVALPGEARAAHIQVQENRDGGVMGLAVTRQNEVYALFSDLSAARLDCPGYDPARHRLKVILDPVSETCTFDDGATVTAVRRPARGDGGGAAPAGEAGRIDRPIPSHAGGPGRAASWFVAPMRLTLLPEDSGFVSPRLSMGGGWSLAGMAVFGLAAALAGVRRAGPVQFLAAFAWGALGGAGAAATAWLWPPEAPAASAPPPRSGDARPPIPPGE
jgi:hypothetical protein